MKYKILRALSCSADGIRVETLAIGSEHEIRAEIVPGLMDAGYITPVIPSTDESRPDAAALGEAVEGFVSVGATPLDLDPAPARRPRGHSSPRR